MASRIRIRPISRIQHKQDVQIPQALQTKSEKRSFEDDLNKCMPEVAKDQPLKKKISLQEYRLRRGVCSNNSSATMRPEAMVPDMPSRLCGKVAKFPVTQTSPDGFLNSFDQMNDEQKFFEPIKEAGYRTQMKFKKQKDEANRRREEAIIKSRMRNVDQFQPLMNDSEKMKLLGMTQPKTVPEPMEKPQLQTSRSSSSLSDSSSGYSSSTTSSTKLQGSCRESNTPVDELKIVFVGRLEKEVTKQTLGNQFAKFGRVVKVRLHSKENGIRYGFVTYERARDAWSAVKAAGTFAQYDVKFGAHCAFFRQTDADLDGVETKYKKSAIHGQEVLPAI